VELPTSSAAVARARSLAATKPGADAFSRTGDPKLGDFADAVVLFEAGDVPDDLTVNRCGERASFRLSEASQGDLENELEAK